MPEENQLVENCQNHCLRFSCLYTDCRKEMNCSDTLVACSTTDMHERVGRISRSNKERDRGATAAYR